MGFADARPKIKLLEESPGRVRWLTDAEREKLEGELPVAVIREAIADGDALAKKGKTAGAPTHVFLSRLGTPYTSSGVSGLFCKVVERASVKNFHFHDLRHDFATRVRRAGHGLDVVQDLLGIPRQCRPRATRTSASRSFTPRPSEPRGL